MKQGNGSQNFAINVWGGDFEVREIDLIYIYASLFTQSDRLLKNL